MANSKPHIDRAQLIRIPLERLCFAPKIGYSIDVTWRAEFVPYGPWFLPTSRVGVVVEIGERSVTIRVPVSDV